MTTSNDPALRGDDHDHGGPPGADPAAVERGHEEDRVHVRPILVVPILIAVTGAICYGIVTAMFAYFGGPATDEPYSNEAAATRSKASHNERVARISSTDPNAEVQQPRLEGMRKVQLDVNDPEYYRSKRALLAGEGNSPEYHPEQLRADRYEDPVTKKKPLMEYSWADKSKSIARIPIAEAMAIVVGKLKVQDKPVDPNAATAPLRPKMSNSGRSAPAAAAPAPEAKKDH
jgi:hypothetical protein